MLSAFVRLTLIPLVASALALASPASAQNCRARALEALQASAPDGWAVYQRVKDKKFFLHWLDCDDPQFGIPTAVHESVHYLTADLDAFPLFGGGEAKRPHEASKFFAPSRIVGKFGKSDYVDTYLKPGRASSSSDFVFLLDELNAYSHDLNAAVALKDMRREGRTSDHRDGLAALMAFVAIYVERAQASEPSTWDGLRQPAVSASVEKIWGRAEQAMSSSCGIPDFGTMDIGYLKQVCQPEAQSALESVIGRPPVCPTACLKHPDEQAEVPEEEMPEPAHRTLWRHRPARAAPASASDENAASQ